MVGTNGGSRSTPWSTTAGEIPARLCDSVSGSAGNQVVVVIPSLDLIAVRFGELMTKGNFWGGIEQFLLNPLMDSIID